MTGLVTGFGVGTQQCVSLVAQMVKNLPAMQETPVRPLGWEDPREKGVSNHSSILAWKIPWTEEPVRLQSRAHKESVMTERLTHTHTHTHTHTQFGCCPFPPVTLERNSFQDFKFL